MPISKQAVETFKKAAGESVSDLGTPEQKKKFDQLVQLPKFNNETSTEASEQIDRPKNDSTISIASGGNNMPSSAGRSDGKQSSWTGTIIMVSVAILFLAVIMVGLNSGYTRIHNRVFSAKPLEPVYTNQYINIFIDVAEPYRGKELFSAIHHQILKSPHYFIARIAFGDTVVARDITHKMEPSELDKIFVNFKSASVVTTNLEQLDDRSIVITNNPAKYSSSCAVLVLDSKTSRSELEKPVKEFLHKQVLMVSGWELQSLYTPGSLLPSESVNLVFTVKNAHPTKTIPKSFRFNVIDEIGQRRSINPIQTFGQDILPGTEIKVTVPIRFNTVNNSYKGAISSLFTDLYVIAMDSKAENKLFVKGNYKFDTKLLRPMFEDYSGPKAVIFPFGAPGVGKTTFLKTILYALGYTISYEKIEPVSPTNTLHLSAKIIGNITIMDSFGIQADVFKERDVIQLARGGLRNTTSIDAKSKQLNFNYDPDGLRPNVLFILYSYLDPVDHESYNSLMKHVIYDTHRSKRAEVAFGFTFVNGVTEDQLNSKTNKLVSKENINVKNTKFDPPKRLEYHLDSDGKPTTRMMLEYLNNLVELTYKAAEWDPNAIIDFPIPGASPL